MTGFDSKRQMAQDKLNDEADTLTIVYQQGFADGKGSAERKPLTDEEIQKIWDGAAGAIPGWSRHIAYARAVEAAHNIKEGT